MSRFDETMMEPSGPLELTVSYVQMIQTCVNRRQMIDDTNTIESVGDSYGTAYDTIFRRSFSVHVWDPGGAPTRQRFLAEKITCHTPVARGRQRRRRRARKGGKEVDSPANGNLRL